MLWYAILSHHSPSLRTTHVVLVTYLPMQPTLYLTNDGWFLLLFHGACMYDDIAEDVRLNRNLHKQLYPHIHIHIHIHVYIYMYIYVFIYIYIYVCH